MYELALFAGAGGGLLASKWLLGWRTVCYIEKEKYPVEILKVRIRDGLLDDAPIWSDVRSFTKRNNACRPFIRQLRKIRRNLVITAGFPCQPFSSAGKQFAGNDKRNGWPDTIRIIREIRPAYVFLENVPGLLTGSHGYFGTVLRELAESGYDARWRVLSAAEVGAPHQRDRLWIVAYGQRGGISGRWGIEDFESLIIRQGGIYGNDVQSSNEQEKEILADAEQIGWNGRTGTQRQTRRLEFEDRNRQNKSWETEPALGRVANGVAYRVDRLKAIGNGQVPDVAAAAWHLLTDDM